MSGAVALGEGIFWVGVNDRETDLFEALWPMPGGVRGWYERSGAAARWRSCVCSAATPAGA